MHQRPMSNGRETNTKENELKIEKNLCFYIFYMKHMGQTSVLSGVLKRLVGSSC